MRKAIIVVVLALMSFAAHADEPIIGVPEHPVDNTDQVAAQYRADMRQVYLQQAIEHGDSVSVAKYSAGERIAADKKGLADCDRLVRFAENQLHQDDETARISGYQNAWARQQAATIIVDCRHSMKRYWADYRAAGGKAETPYDLEHE